MRFTYPQYNHYESLYRIAGKHTPYQHKNYAMRMTMATASTMTPRIHRKGFRTPSKRHPGKVLPGKLHSISRVGPGKIAPGKKIIPRPHPPPCDNSNDSGFGFDQHVEVQNNQQVVRSIQSSRFLSTMGRNNVRPGLKRPTAPAQSNISTSSKDGTVQLEIISQPEQQHRARYQTEGSRGAVKDRSGNGFPIVRLTGYNRPALLQVFIGTDIGRVAPHMFYQACKVAGKNSTPCTERKVDGTMIIEIDFKPENDMTITCDCVGILKERNVDVEHRFPEHSAQRSKKKSTRCRMVFRTQLTHDDGTIETLQVCSYPIICTQPPGVPEICKKSLTSCPVEGGLELFIIGKNFLKDTCVVFRDSVETPHGQGEMTQITSVWEETVIPDKEYLQQTHLVCTVPPYIHQSIIKPVIVQLFVMSSGKKSENHSFMYTPKGTHSVLSASTTLSTLHSTLSAQQDSPYTDNTTTQPCPSVVLWGSNVIEPKHEIDSDMMPPPTTIPISVRRPSASSTLISDQMASIGLKTEIMDENSQSSTPEAMQTDSLDQFPSPNENTVDTGPIKEMQFQRIRKQNVDVIDMRSIPMLNDTNSLSNFPESHNHLSVVDLAVKQEQMASQLQRQMLTAAQAQQTVNKFFPNIDSNMTELKTPVESVSVNPLFVNASNNNSNSIFPQSVSNMGNSIEQSFATNMLPNNNAQTNINQMLNLPQTDSPKCVRSPSSNSSSNGIHSPITQDIILNSEPAASINSANMQILSQAPDASQTERITSELILNPTVSPTIMCPSNSDPNNLIVNQVTMANTILNDISLSSQTTQDNILNNMMINQPPDQMHVTGKTSPVNVNNMILKAAADFITQQERNISTESTINALISLNTSPILTEQQQTTVSQILNIPSNSQATSNSPVLMQNEQQRIDICPQTATMSQQLNPFNESNVIANHQIMDRRDLSTKNNNPMNNVPLGNLILNEVTRTPQEEYLQNLQKANQLTASVTQHKDQESLLQAVSLVRSELEKPKIDGSVESIAIQQSNNLTQTTSSTQPSVTTTIPQDITTMSDQDLISYINPSTFDQV